MAEQNTPSTQRPGLAETVLEIPADSVRLEGALAIPENARGIVLFAHGSGSSRHSRRNNFVARILQSGGVGTLLMDLLTRDEDSVYETRFDIGLLTRRLTAATHWLAGAHPARGLPVGYFGASTGAAAALEAAAELGERIAAVVSRGGRPDLATNSLHLVRSPTLLIVGELDEIVVQLNRKAYDRLQCIKEMAIVPGATHLFEEPGALERVAGLALSWFQRHFGKSTA